MPLAVQVLRGKQRQTRAWEVRCSGDLAQVLASARADLICYSRDLPRGEAAQGT